MGIFFNSLIINRFTNKTKVTFAVVCFPIFLLSTLFIWFFASKNKNSTKQKNSDPLENETALLCTLQEASNNRNDKNEKVISKENSNDNNINAPVSPIENYSLFFDEKNTQLPNSIQDQHASASIAKHAINRIKYIHSHSGVIGEFIERLAAEST